MVPESWGAMMVISASVILAAGVIAVRDGFRSDYACMYSFLHFLLIITACKAYDMVSLAGFASADFTFPVFLS